MAEGQHQALETLHRDEAAGAVKLERCSVAGFCLDRYAECPGGDSCLRNGTQQRAPCPAAAGARHDIKIAKLPATAQPQRSRQRDSGGQARQILTLRAVKMASRRSSAFSVSHARARPGTTGCP